MKRILLGVVAVLVWTACGDDPQIAVSTTVVTETVATLPARTTVPAPDLPTAAEQACGGTGEGFVSDGLLSWLGSASGDGQHISRIMLTDIEECERLQIVLTTSGGSPATDLPLVEVRLLDTGILRAAFDPVVWSTSITDSLLEGTLVERVYVVRGMDGRLFVDAHLNQPVDARATTGTNPSHVVIDLRPNDRPPHPSPIISRSIVMTWPADGAVTYPLAVTGYARGQPTVAGLVTDTTPTETLAEPSSTTPVAGYGALTWGEFRLEIEAGPLGPATLVVGELSAAGEFSPGLQVNVVAN